jgi:N-acetylmuramic acid 6-phosphate etherase
MRALSISTNDVAILVAASGRTPYALGALAQARRAGALTIGLANNADTPLLRDADIAICLPTGPEVVAGSTRLKAGTAQKIALNTLSTALMVRLRKTHGHLMVDLQVTNAKLRERAVVLVSTLVGCDPAVARQTLARCEWRVKAAVLVLRRGLGPEASQALLDACGGWLRQALDAPLQAPVHQAPSGAPR